jgi:hypothetical protein
LAPKLVASKTLNWSNQVIWEESSSNHEFLVSFMSIYILVAQCIMKRMPFGFLIDLSKFKVGSRMQIFPKYWSHVRKGGGGLSWLVCWWWHKLHNVIFSAELALTCKTTLLHSLFKTFPILVLKRFFFKTTLLILV